MKVLFGINNDDTVKSIVGYYEEKYKEKIEYKNVYYFKQFIQELSTGEYDRAVVLEELEKFPTNNLAQIDAYLFKNIDSMTDSYDAKNIVYIASDRRKLGDEFLSRLFNLGMYSVLTGQDRTKGKTSAAIKTPYSKKDVKKYYDRISSDSAYKAEEVSEIEIQRIISYYQNQNGVVDRYNEIFDRIATQYTNEQLKVIINFLPVDVKKYLAANNEKFKAIMAISNIPEPVVQPVAPQATPQVEPQVATPPVVAPVVEAPKPPKEILNSQEDAKAIEIKKEPEIIEKIVVQKVEAKPQIITQVVEKEVVKEVFEVPKDYKKTVCFVGASKVGTTFCINAIGTYLAKNKIKTAIVDLTKKRDTYTIYTYDNEGKRHIAAQSLTYASNGMNEPLIYDKLSIYTSMPGDDRKKYNPGVLVDTIAQNNNVVLIDTDFTTPAEYFRICQEIYIVQDMNILNISQLTLFLRELKSRGIAMNKLRLIINKHVKCALTSKDILDGIATYTSYDLKMYDELFNSATIPYYILPFDVENYKKYVEMIYKYTNKFNTFTDDFKEALDRLITSVYPVSGIVTKKRNSSAKSKSSGSLFRK